MPVREEFFAFLDTETGGLTPGKDQVIEVATVLTDLQLKEVGRYEAKVKLRPNDTVSPEAAAINGYDPRVWAAEARPFEEYMNFLQLHIPRGTVAIPVGHNVGFDRDMIDLGYYKPAGRFCPLAYHKIDTVGLAGALRWAGVFQSRDLKLTSISAALGIAHARAHSAMADLLVSKEIFERTARFMKRAKLQPAN